MSAGPCRYNRGMNKDTIDRLLAVNREFYAEFAEHFAASRPVSDPALTCILPYLPSSARILDVGCGDGRLALLLHRTRPGSLYVGVDATPELIEVARSQTDRLGESEVTLRVVDVTRQGWTASLPHAPYDCVVMLAVLHHIPSFDLRAQVLREVAEVLRAEGHAILSTWRFLAHRRLRRKIVDWDCVDIDEGELESGDYLIDWKRGGQGLRYCHLIDEAEVDDLADASGFVVRETFRAGGREGDMSLFAILDPAVARGGGAGPPRAWGGGVRPRCVHGSR